MLMAALFSLVQDKQYFLQKMNALLPGIAVSPEEVYCRGVHGIRMSVAIDGLEENSVDCAPQKTACRFPEKYLYPGMPAATNKNRKLIARLALPDAVIENIYAVHRIITDAEAAVHGRPVDRIHFSRLGNLDAIADIAGVCLLIHMLAPARIVASPIHVGSGYIECPHGILPVPAPATAHILSGVPTYGGAIKGELCTPTGAAILKHFAFAFQPMPYMEVTDAGNGFGKKQFKAASCVRALMGQRLPAGSSCGAGRRQNNKLSINESEGNLWKLCCRKLLK